ncbi:hypothetical protein UlMin_045997 [Ulmus minor]
MDKANPLSTPMVVRSLNVEKDPFRPCEDNEEIVGPEVPYLSAIGALMYLANCTRPDIAFAVNLLARFSSSPTRRHWNGIKHIFRYLQGTIDLGLFYPNKSRKGLIGYTDAGHVSDPHKARSQTGYVFTCGDTAISWRSQKQTLVATSSNHAEVIALHEFLMRHIHIVRRPRGSVMKSKVLAAVQSQQSQLSHLISYLIAKLYTCIVYSITIHVNSDMHILFSDLPGNCSWSVQWSVRIL